MAFVAAAAAATAVATPIVTCAAAMHKAAVTGFSSPIRGLQQLGVRGGRVRCSASDEKAAVVPVGKTAMLAAAATAANVISASNSALALVDERMSTEGTGLSLGLSNNLLGWILLGIFGLIWALYFVYTSTLEEDDDSGLSL